MNFASQNSGMQSSNAPLSETGEAHSFEESPDNHETLSHRNRTGLLRSCRPIRSFYMTGRLHDDLCMSHPINDA